MAVTPKAEFRAAPTDDGKKYLEGYFIRFNEETELFPGYFEQVAPKAIRDDIADQDVRALFNHDSGSVLGRTTNGTLELRKDKTGLFARVLVNEEDAEALSIYAKVSRGDVSSASFGFNIEDDDLSQRDDGTWHDVLREIQLNEISVVAFPAYPTTEIEARQRDLGAFKKERFQQRKTQLIKELEEKCQIRF
jgi:HK97 family phage prohead protease